MNENINKLIVGIQEQAPDVARQMAEYGAVSSIIEIVASLAVLALLAWAFFREYDDSDSECVAKLFSFLAACVALLFLCDGISCFVHAKFYPKAYLAEKIIRSIK